MVNTPPQAGHIMMYHGILECCSWRINPKVIMNIGQLLANGFTPLILLKLMTRPSFSA